jgi:hypothetical protein
MYISCSRRITVLYFRGGGGETKEREEKTKEREEIEKLKTSGIFLKTKTLIISVPYIVPFKLHNLCIRHSVTIDHRSEDVGVRMISSDAASAQNVFKICGLF